MLREIEKKLKHARIIPNYLLILVYSLGILSLSLLGYFGYSLHARQNEKFEIYRMVMESDNESHQRYFSKNPDIKDDYCQWLKEKK